MYLALAKDTAFNPTDVAIYSDLILTWWRTHAKELPNWAKAARIMFAFSPNSASCERVFSLLKNFIGEQQISTLADYIGAALMLAYNERSFG